MPAQNIFGARYCLSRFPADVGIFALPDFWPLLSPGRGRRTTVFSEAGWLPGRYLRHQRNRK